MTNFLIVTEVFPPKCGGAGWSSFYLCQKILKSGHNVIVAQLFGKNEQYENIKIIPIKPKYNNRLFKEVFIGSMRKQIQQIVDEHKIDIVHSQHLLSSLAIGKIKTASKYRIVSKIVTLRDYWLSCFNGTLYDKKNNVSYEPSYWKDFKVVFNDIGLKSFVVYPYMFFRTLRAQMLVKNFELVICGSNFIRDKCQRNLKNNLFVTTAYNSIDVERLKKIEPKKFDKTTIVFLGKLNIAKGPMVLLEALKELNDKKIKTYFIGNGELKETLQNFAMVNNIDAEFLDYLPNDKALSYAKGADILVYPSQWNEPLGRVVLESFGIGACLISSNKGGAPEVVIDKYNGILFDGSIDDLVKALVFALNNPEKCEEIRKNALITANDFQI